VVLDGHIAAFDYHIENPLLAISCVWGAVFAAALALYGISKVVVRKGQRSDVDSTPYGIPFLPRILGVGLLAFLAAAIYGAYAVPALSISYFSADPELYQPDRAFIAIAPVMYEARTKMGFTVLQILNSYGGNVVSLPTSVLILSLALAVLLLCKGQKAEMPPYIAFLLLGNLFYPLVMGAVGQVGAPRYYGAHINLFLIGVLILLPSLIDGEKVLAHNKQMFAGGGMYIIPSVVHRTVLLCPKRSGVQSCMACPRKGAERT
jgi:hypothetical protein